MRKSKENPVENSFINHRGKAIRILLAMYQGNYHRFLLSGFFYGIKHSPAWLMPIVITNVVNMVMNPDSDSMTIILMNVVVLGFLVLLNIPMNYLHIRFSSKAIRSVEADLRSTIIRKLQHLSISYHKENQAGKLQSKVMRDVEAIQTLSTQLFVSLLNITINISVALVITILNNRMIFLFFLMTIPVASLTIVVFRSKIKNQHHRFRKEIENTAAKVMDMEEMIPVTRAHGLEEVEMTRMNRLIKNIFDEGHRLDLIQANFGSISWAIFEFFQIACLVFTASLVIKGSIQAGDIVLYQSYFTTVVTQVSALIMLLPTIAKGLESVISISEVMDEYDIEDNTGKLILEGLEGSYVFDCVNFTYEDGKGKAVKDFSLKVKSGQIVAFVGESGAGKSTLMNLLVGFNLVDSGDLLVDGYLMKDIHLRSYRKRIAVVPQNTILFSGTIRDNITYGLSKVTDKEYEEAVRAANLSDLIENLPEGSKTLVGERGNKLSGGQRQRIAIARAIIRKPQVILFDEATSALDSVSEALILDALSKLVEGRTTFVVAHRLSTIRKADIICVMKNGQCVESGTYEELLEEEGEFYRMHILQV